MAFKRTASVLFTDKELFFVENSMSCATPNIEDMGPEERSAYEKVRNALLRTQKPPKPRKSYAYTEYCTIRRHREQWADKDPKVWTLAPDRLAACDRQIAVKEKRNPTFKDRYEAGDRDG